MEEKRTKKTKMIEDKNLILISKKEQKEFFNKMKKNPEDIDKIFDDLYKRKEKELKKEK